MLISNVVNPAVQYAGLSALTAVADPFAASIYSVSNEVIRSAIDLIMNPALKEESGIAFAAQQVCAVAGGISITTLAGRKFSFDDALTLGTTYFSVEVVKVALNLFQEVILQTAKEKK